MTTRGREPETAAEGVAREAEYAARNAANIKWLERLFDEAQEELERIEQTLPPADASAHVYVSRLLMAQGRWDEAARRYLAMLESLASGAAPPPAAEA